MKMMIRVLMTCDACGQTETCDVRLDNYDMRSFSTSQYRYALVRSGYHYVYEDQNDREPDHVMCGECFRRYQDMFRKEEQ